MKTRVFLAAIWLVGGAWGASASEARPQAPNDPSPNAAQATELSFPLSEASPFRVFRMAHPQRLVIDLRHAHLARGAHLPRATGAIEAIRAGARPNGGLRLVLQLSTPLPANVRWGSAEGSGRVPLVIRLGGGGSAGGSPASATNVSASVPNQPGSSASVPMSAPVLVSADEPARPVRVAHAPGEAERDLIVAVDAGHGGEDPGAIGHGGTQEKEVTLAIARALARRINAEPGMHALLTRDRDEFVSLRERIQRARLGKADLFVSVHADSIRDSAVSGASVYVLSERGASNEAARWLAERENSADLIGGVSLADKDHTLASVLLDLTQTSNISASMMAAERVLGSLEQVGEVRKARVQQAGFVVLKSPDIPSMLIETAYISNPAEERRLRELKHQDELAEAIFGGLHAYFAQNPPAGTRFARLRVAATSAGAVLAGTSAGSAAALPGAGVPSNAASLAGGAAPATP
jgi:N-acetylmuramoyl-L-alanine amidase